MPFATFLLADQNKDARCQRDKIEQEYGRPKIHAKPQQAINHQINRKQSHTDASIQFHAFSFLGRAARLTIQIFSGFAGAADSFVREWWLLGALGVAQMRATRSSNWRGQILFDFARTHGPRCC